MPLHHLRLLVGGEGERGKGREGERGGVERGGEGRVGVREGMKSKL